MSDLKTETKPEGYYLYTGSEITYENRYQVHGFTLYERTTAHDLAQDLGMDLESAARFVLALMDAPCQFESLVWNGVWQPDQEAEMMEQLKGHPVMDAEADELWFVEYLRNLHDRNPNLYYRLDTIVRASSLWHWSEPSIQEHVDYFTANPGF